MAPQASVASTATTVAIIVQGVEMVIPGFIELWQAIQGLRAKNPDMTPEGAKVLMASITAAIKSLDDDTLAKLDLIPAAPKGA